MSPPRPALTPEARGAVLVVLATVLFGVMDTVAKLLTERYDPTQVVWARYTGQTLIVLATVLPNVAAVARTSNLPLQLARSILMFGATLSGFIAFSLLPLATAVAVFQVAPLVMTAMAAIWLHEAVGPRRWLGVAVGFCGALIIVRPGTSVFDPAALLPLFGAFCYAGNTVMTRLLAADGNRTTLLYSAAVGTVVSSLWMPFVWVTPGLVDALMMAAMALVGAGGQLLLIRAFAAAEASALAPFTYASMIVSAAFGYAVWSDVPDLPTIVGATVIVASGLYVWHRERIRARSPA
jgi:drug/metabolite transporter (DMT)-like permease